MTAWAVVAGLVFGVGAWALVASVPRLSTPRLAERVAPHVVDVSATARADVERVATSGLSLFGAIIGPAASALRDAVLQRLGGEASVALRLRQAGSPRTVESFRAAQLTVAAGAAAAGGAISVAIGSSRLVTPVGHATVIAVLGLGGFVACDMWLSRAARRRLARIAEEFPTVAELLALGLSAGEGSFDALRRVAAASSGQFGRELRAVAADVNLGVPLVEALERMSRALRLPRLALFVDAVVGAIERGAPLAEVLRAQAGDARAERKRELLEVAGRKEVAMLVPLIFGLLPLTVVVAVFPGVFILRAGL